MTPPANTARRPGFSDYLSLIKFSHTIFALPFALVGFALATLEQGVWSWRNFALVLLCMVFGRSAAMAFNRYLDRHIDAANPRSQQREIPAGIISARSALVFVLLNGSLFVLTTWFINPLCFALSPVALLVILGYSYTKRFTFLCHFVLGLGLALAPVGAWLASGAYWDLLPILYGVTVLLWVAGFDIIYALQDEQFDRQYRLQSVPVWLGGQRALGFSTVLHLLCALAVLAATYLQGQRYPELAWLHWLGTLGFLALLFYQHTLVKSDDLSRVNMAFFTTNGLASLWLGALVLIDVWLL